MATEFLMPKLGLTMEEGTILQWLVDDGSTVESGDALMIIETDKVESDVEANGTGRLHRIGEEGQTFRCGEVVGLLLEEGESLPVHVSRGTVVPPIGDDDAGASRAPTISTIEPPTPTVLNGARRFVSPNARRIASERGIELGSVRGTGPGGRVVSEDLDDPSVANAAARDLADLLGIDLTTVAPDPGECCVTVHAVAGHVRARLHAMPSTSPDSAPSRSAAPAAAITGPAPTQTPTSTRRVIGMRATIARRMLSSLHDMAQLTLTMDADMDAVVDDRFRRSSTGTAPSYTDYVIAAVGRALRLHPGINAQVTPDGIALLPDIHVGLAVALDDGLIVPVVRHADRLTITEVAAATRQLANAARHSTLTSNDLQDGTFSVSALGMFGVDAFTPVINPPNVAILGVGRVRDDLRLAAGSIEVVRRMTLSLTWDHRVLDGAPAAKFCSTIVELLNDPAALD